VTSILTVILQGASDVTTPLFTNDLVGFIKAIARQSEQAAATQRMIGEASRDTMQAITSSGDAQLRAVHAVELQVERLKGQADFAECLSQFSTSIERLVNRLTEREG
jgi:hypothetical protein